MDTTKPQTSIQLQILSSFFFVFNQLQRRYVRCFHNIIEVVSTSFYPVPNSVSRSHETIFFFPFILFKLRFKRACSRNFVRHFYSAAIWSKKKFCILYFAFSQQNNTEFLLSLRYRFTLQPCPIHWRTIYQVKPDRNKNLKLK